MTDEVSKNRPWRTPVQRARDRVQIAEWYLKSKTQAWIAAELSRIYYPDHEPIDQSQISLDIKAIIQGWKESAINDIAEQRQVELEKVNRLELTYWDAWERSCANKQTKAARKRLGKDADAGNTVQSVTDESRDGNPAFLAGVQWCVNKRCELMGLNAPIKSQNENIDLSTLNEQQLELLAGGADLYTVLSTKSES
jgi:hypothetical protein